MLYEVITELPPGFRKLQQAVEEKIQDINAFSKQRVRSERMDPYDITNAKERNKLFESLVSLGLQPTDLRLARDEGTVTHLIFPGAILHYKDKTIGVNLLKNNPALSAEINLNNSAESIEYELMRAFQQLIKEEKEEIAFLIQHKESSMLADLILGGEGKSNDPLSNRITSYNVCYTKLLRFR